MFYHGNVLIYERKRGESMVEAFRNITSFYDSLGDRVHVERVVRDSA